jgi:hypothetical protein
MFEFFFVQLFRFVSIGLEKGRFNVFFVNHEIVVGVEEEAQFVEG